jgi:galactose oxidase
MAFDRNHGENQLDVDDIQGDILVGLQKDFEIFVGFAIADVTAFRTFLGVLTPRITTLRSTLEREFILKMRHNAASKEVFSFIGTNIGFTAAGLNALGIPNLDKIKDTSFRAGLVAQSAGLNDPTSGIGAPGNWVIGGPAQSLHGLLIITGPDRPSVYAQLDRIDVFAGTSWMRLGNALEGSTREQNRGHEHFGFLDGVSQPGVRGQINSAFPSHQFLTPGENPNDAGQGLPGQDLLWPGEFVFGYPGQKPDDVDTPGDISDGGLSWMKNGSFMVFRRLKQLVPEFEAFCADQATSLDMDEGLIAARMVGRWPSGTPLVTSPLQDNAVLAKDDMLINAFEFTQDKLGRRCPFAAHIRKSYPRNDITPAAKPGTPEFDQRKISESTTQMHRIIRAGIPFGDEVSDDERRAKKTLNDRGLMFVCYQTSIVDQFEFIQKAWVNDRTFPPAAGADGSEDPIIGQAAGASRQRRFVGAGPEYPSGPRGDAIELPSDFVIPTGGGYFFVPSIDTLANSFAVQGDHLAAGRIGKWGPVLNLPNVPVHVHLLPNGKILFWGRRVDLHGSMDQHLTETHILDTASGTTTPAAAPTMPDKTPVNLFCSSHALLPDGRLFVAGGHWKDSEGVNQACIYDWAKDSWEALAPMNEGRWYPTVTALADGSMLVTSGSFLKDDQTPNNPTPQIWNGSGWRNLDGRILSLYPRQHVISEDRVFVAGTDPASAMLDLKGNGAWSGAPSRSEGDRQYAPSLTYRPGQIIFIGGGNDPGTNVPTAICEVIDFNNAVPAWRMTAAMWHRRRQHNATLLPDGTILVTGGTQGGGFDGGFNDLNPGEPVHEAELWDPSTGRWTVLAAEDKDRCYHSTAILLPDATVLSAGGGEYNPNGQPIRDQDVHTDAQIFHPPYLFRGARPVIETAPAKADYGATFTIRVSGPSPQRITALKLGSVTHSLDANQRFMELGFELKGSQAKVVVPASRADYPPGFYMLFALSATGVPSIARIIQIGKALPAKRFAKTKARTARSTAQSTAQSPYLAEGLTEHDEKVEAASTGTRVTVGLTSRCPYGLAACWGGAYQTLRTLDGVAVVKAVADAQDSTAELFLSTNGLPNLDVWQRQFSAMANGSYDFRGVEVALDGLVTVQGDHLILSGPSSTWTVKLDPLGETAKVQWDWAAKTAAAPTADEISAYQRLADRVQAAGGQARAQVSGPLSKDGGTWRLAVRAIA